MVAVTLIGSMLATTTLVLQQASAQGVIVEYKTLSEQFQKDVLDLVSSDPPSEDNAVNPPDPDKLAALFDNYKQDTFKIFEIEPPEPDSQTKGDPPIEVDPPDPDLSR